MLIDIRDSYIETKELQIVKVMDILIIMLQMLIELKEERLYIL